MSDHQHLCHGMPCFVGCVNIESIIGKVEEEHRHQAPHSHFRASVDASMTCVQYAFDSVAYTPIVFLSTRDPHCMPHHLSHTRLRTQSLKPSIVA